MARITYEGPFALKVRIAVANIISARADLARVKGIMDNLTSGGTQTALLEGSEEFGVNAGNGAGFYSAVVALNTAVQSINAATLNNIDRGD
jgi:hypothetical protein